MDLGGHHDSEVKACSEQRMFVVAVVEERAKRRVGFMTANPG